MGISVTRFPNGVTNSNVGSLFEDLCTMDPTKLHTYFNDFDTFAAGDWVITETQAGATQALVAGDGGLLALVNSAADDDLNAMQKTPAAFGFTPGKKTFFKARFKVSNATQSDIVIGLQVVDTTPLDVTDGVYFLKPDNTNIMGLVCRKDATTGSAIAPTVAAIADDTFIEVGFVYDGADKVIGGVNGVPGTAILNAQNFLPDTVTTISFAVQNGDANARTLTVDYVFAATER